MEVDPGTLNNKGDSRRIPFLVHGQQAVSIAGTVYATRGSNISEIVVIPSNGEVSVLERAKSDTRCWFEVPIHIAARCVNNTTRRVTFWFKNHVYGDAKMGCVEFLVDSRTGLPKDAVLECSRWKFSKPRCIGDGILNSLVSDALHVFDHGGPEEPFSFLHITEVVSGERVSGWDLRIVSAV
jgi:hypothetical protein